MRAHGGHCVFWRARAEQKAACSERRVGTRTTDVKLVVCLTSLAVAVVPCLLQDCVVSGAYFNVVAFAILANIVYKCSCNL